MSRGTLYLETVAGEPLRTRAILVKCLTQYFNLPFKLSPPDDVFPSKFSASKVPALQWENGTIQEESIPIVLALLENAPQSKLLGDGGLVDRSQILQWMCKFNYDIMTPMATLLYLKTGRMEFSQTVHDQAWVSVNANSTWLEGYFATHEYLVRNELTVADLYGVTFFYRGLGYFFDSQWRSDHPSIMKWWTRCTNHEIFGGFFKSMQMYDKSG